MKKYQALSELSDKMTQNKFNKRPESCQQILNDSNSWALIANDINKVFKYFPNNCDEEYKKSYVFKLIELMTENAKSNHRYHLDSDEIDGTSENYDSSEDTDSIEYFNISDESDSFKIKSNLIKKQSK